MKSRWITEKEAIDRIRLLFQIEKAAAHLSDEDRVQFRQEKSGPLLEELRSWCFWLLLCFGRSVLLHQRRP